MPTSNRRRLLAIAGGALTVAVAGCSGGNDNGDSTDGDPSETETTTATDSGPSLQAPDGDAALTLSLDGGASEFETLTIDLDRIVMRGDTGTDDATLSIGDSGLDMTGLPEDGKTYFEEESFPSGNYTAADCFLTVDEAVTSEGDDVTFDGESPVTIDLVLFDDPLEVPSGSTTTLNLTLTATTTFEDEFTFSKGWSSSSG